MVLNPLFDNQDDSRAGTGSGSSNGYLLPNGHGRMIQPLHNTKPQDSLHSTPSSISPVNPSQNTSGQSASDGDNSTPAVELIRRKVEMLFTQEPNASAELQATAAQVIQPTQRSKHQEFMHELSTSGKSLAEIQTAWHQYYASLPDTEKHSVWQEFYAANAQHPSAYTSFTAEHPEAARSQAVVGSGLSSQPINPAQPQTPVPKFMTQRGRHKRKQGGQGSSTTAVASVDQHAQHSHHPAAHAPSEKPSEEARPIKPTNKQVAALKRQIKQKVRVNTTAQAKVKQHLRSLVFGLGTGTLVTLVVLFGLFNQIVITPFIQPSRHAEATPIILSTSDIAPTPNPEVIIPKINLEIPVDYTQTTTDEKAIQSALNTGTVHYASTSKPGEKGNVGIFGHSSNNIFNPGKYKFAFVLLHTLVPGDIFYLTYNDKVYSYRVYDKQVVNPSNVAVLNPVAGKVATATLITCDPPGTSLNRLVVWGEQINPDPVINTDATIVPTATAPAKITGNGPSLWHRITSWF